MSQNIFNFWSNTVLIKMLFCNEFRNEIIEKIQIENNCHNVPKKNKNVIRRGKKVYDYVDLTEDTPRTFNQAPLKINTSESHRKDGFFNNENTFDSATISSVASWTSSSDDILCSNNPQVIKLNYILSHER